MNRRAILGNLAKGWGLVSMGSFASTGLDSPGQAAYSESVESEFDINYLTEFFDSYLGRDKWNWVDDGPNIINMPSRASYELNQVVVTLKFNNLTDLVPSPKSDLFAFEFYSLDHVNREKGTEADQQPPRFIAKFQLIPSQIPELSFRYRARTTFVHLILVAKDLMNSRSYVAIRYVKHPLWSGPKYDGSY